MLDKHRRVIVVVLAGLMLFGCNFPGTSSNVSPITSPTMYIMTLSALQTKSVMTATAQGVGSAFTPAPIPPSGGLAVTGTPLVGGTPAHGSVVIKDTLCWRGPGPRYESISAIFKGTLVQLVGRSAAPGWYIIVNPIYHDPCWVQASDVQVDPSVNVNALPVYAIPASPTPIPFPTRTLGPVTPTLARSGATASPVSPLPTTTPPPPLPSATTAPGIPATPTPSGATAAPTSGPPPTGTP